MMILLSLQPTIESCTYVRSRYKLPKQRPKRPENAWFMYYLPCPSWSLRVAGEHIRLTSSVSSLLLRLMLMDENGWEILMQASQSRPLNHLMRNHQIKCVVQLGNEIIFIYSLRFSFFIKVIKFERGTQFTQEAIQIDFDLMSNRCDKNAWVMTLEFGTQVNPAP